MRTYVLVIFFIGFAILACQKDDINDNNKGSAKMQLITSAAWKYDTAGIDVDGNGTIDQQLPAGIPEPCDKDNLITLKKDSTGTVDEGPGKCDPATPQITNITWQFRNNETVINIPDTLYGSISGDADILELTATKLRISKQTQLNLGPIPVPVKLIVNLKH